MFDSLVNQFATMSMGEEIYTICFTAFFVIGGMCCFRRSELPRNPVRQLQAAPKPQPRRRGERQP